MSTNTSIETALHTAEMSPALGVMPPSRSALHSSTRSAPPRSEPIADSTESTQISRIMVARSHQISWPLNVVRRKTTSHQLRKPGKSPPDKPHTFCRREIKGSIEDELHLPKLKAVPRRELQTPLLRPDRVLTRDLAKGGIRDGCVWIPVTDDVEGVKSIEAELECLLSKSGETLEGRQVHIEVSRTAHRAIARGSKGVDRRHAEGADAIVHSGSGAGGRRRIGAEPAIDAPTYNPQL